MITYTQWSKDKSYGLHLRPLKRGQLSISISNDDTTPSEIDITFERADVFNLINALLKTIEDE